MTETTMNTSDVRYVKELYPRLRPDDEAIERYRASIDRLPAIVVARDGVLVDGYHRWQAHVREGVEEIKAIDLGNITDVELEQESVSRNSDHGLQLSRREKQAFAAKWWASLSHLPSADRQSTIATKLKVSEKSVQRWTKDARKSEKEETQARAWELWLDCRNQPDIAETIGVDKATVSRWLQERQTSEMQPPESRQHFDIWTFQTSSKDAGQQSYFGALPPQVVENLAWLYTDPGDTIVDLFAGSGTTIEVAKSMGRRVWASDISGNKHAPYLPIHQHDATTGWPDAAPNKAEFVILDPPYWKQAKGRYSQADNELAELTDVAAFYEAWANVLASVKGHTRRVAYIISPTQQPDGTVIDHATDMLKAAWKHDFTVERRIIVPYNTQQATGQQVEWAREKKRLLKLYRDLVVLRHGV